MIGQEGNIRYLQNLADSNEFPRLLILSGQPNTGKKTMAKYIAKQVLAGCVDTETDSSIAGVRAAIELSYKATMTICYIFDGDKLSSEAQSALLKVTEEPPRKAYFIITISTGSKISEALTSRSMIMRMEPYSQEQVREFVDDEYAAQLATSPGQALILKEYAQELFEYANKVVGSIAEVTGVNAMKIPLKLKLNEGQEGYDPLLFLNAVVGALISKLQDCQDRDRLKGYMQAAIVCSKYYRKLTNKSVRKDSLMDAWVLDMRAALICNEEG